MPPLLLAQLIVVAALCGLTWTVQLAIYPQFARVGAAEFRAWHASYMRAIGWVAGPLMVAELGLAAAWWVLAPAGGGVCTYKCFALAAATWVVTFAVLVPLHGRLQAEGFSARVHARLMTAHTLRTAIWTLRLGLLVLMALL
jgi:hypothetical protein